MQETSTEQPRVYRHTRTMLKIRSTPTEGESTAQMKQSQEASSLTPQQFPMGPETVLLRILKVTLYLTLCSCHCSV